MAVVTTNCYSHWGGSEGRRGGSRRARKKSGVPAPLLASGVQSAKSGVASAGLGAPGPVAPLSSHPIPPQVAPAAQPSNLSGSNAIWVSRCSPISLANPLVPSKWSDAGTHYRQAPKCQGGPSENSAQSPGKVQAVLRALTP